MKTKKSMVILLVLLLSLSIISSSFLTGCSSSPATTTSPASSTASVSQSNPSPTQSSSGTSVIRWGSNAVGSSGYTLSAGMTSLIAKYTDYKASVIPSGGSAATVRAISRGDRDFGFGGDYDIYAGYNGIGEFAKEGKQNVLAVGMCYTTGMTIVAQPGINTINDLKGKKFMYRRSAVATFGIFGDAVLKAYGLGDSTVNVETDTDEQEVLDALKTGTIDAGLVPGAIPNAFTTQLMETKNFSLISLNEDTIAAIHKANPFLVPVTIPAGTYKGQTQDIHTMGFEMMIECRTNLPEQEVYEATKAIYGHLDQLATIDPLAKSFSLKGAVENLPIPLHPGAQKYFQEMGVLSK